MEHNHFQIEKSRKVEISIPGYDPVKETQKVAKRYERLRDKHKRKSALAEQQQKDAQEAQLQHQAAALEQLSAAGRAPGTVPVLAAAQSITEDNLFV